MLADGVNRPPAWSIAVPALPDAMRDVRCMNEKAAVLAGRPFDEPITAVRQFE